MGDVELLDLAAKAYASQGIKKLNSGAWFNGARGSYWNPLADDGDALRLAVALRLSVKHGVDIWDDTNSMSAYAYYRDVGECQFEQHGDDPHAATRRAIVRAAAEIGKTKINDLPPRNPRRVGGDTSGPGGCSLTDGPGRHSLIKSVAV